VYFDYIEVKDTNNSFAGHEEEAVKFIPE